MKEGNREKFVVALGSSAGGLKPMIAYFDSTPHDNAIYIILRHIPVDQQSHLHLILQNHSDLKIIEAENNTTIEKDTVYMPPADMHMTIEADKLRLRPRIYENLHPNRSVDIFFESLAHSKPGRCIGIILSGQGTDGSSGAAAIKSANGLILVQTPSSCEYTSMPQSVINAGSADHILDAGEMPDIVLKHISTKLKNAHEVARLKELANSLASKDMQ